MEQDRVLWYNDYEEGFNVSTFTALGTIPADEYWCNQDPLRVALPKLMTGTNPHGDWGPPEPALRGLLKAMKHLILGRSH